MNYKRIPLSEEDNEIYLEAFVPHLVGNTPRKAVLVIPGGSYGQVCSAREGEPVALGFIPHGFVSFVLHYSVGRKHPFPTQLIEASTAIVHIKDHAKEYGIDPEQVFVLGFSAGGHLAGCTGTLWKHPAIGEALDIPYGYNKPRGMMLVYPVVKGHRASFCNLLCQDDPTQEDMEALWLDNLVDEDTVPTFLMHGAKDDLVPVTDSLAMATALSQIKRPFELHIYPNASHGVALGTSLTSMGNPALEDAALAKWVEHAAVWADNLCK